MESGKMQSLKPIQDVVFKFMKGLLEQGPGTGHSKMIGEIFSNRRLQFKDYYKQLCGSELKEHIRFLMREYHNRDETGEDKHRFKIATEHTFRLILDGDSFTDEAFKENQAEFVELYLYMELSFMNRSKEIQDLHHRLSQTLWYKFDRNVFKGINDLALRKKYLKDIEVAICRTNLTTANSEKSLKIFLDILQYILQSTTVEMFVLIHSEILDFVCSLCDKKAGSPIHAFIEAVGGYFYHVKRDSTAIKGNSALFTSMTTKLIQFLNNLEDHTILRVKFIDAAVNNVLEHCIDKTPEHRRLIIDLIKACLRIHQPTAVDAAYRALRGCEKSIKWKEHIEDAREILSLISKVRIYSDDTKVKSKHAKNYIQVCSQLADQLKRDRVVPQLVDDMVEFCFKILENRDPYLFEAANEIACEVEFVGKKNKDLIMSIFPRLIPLLTDEKFPWKQVSFSKASNTVVTLSGNGIEALDSKLMKPEDYTVIGRFLRIVVKGDFIDEDRNEPGTVFYILFINSGTRFLRLLDDVEKMQRSILLIREIVNLLTHEYEEIVSMAITQISVLSSQGARCLAPFFQKILEIYADNENPQLLHPLTAIYPFNPKPIEPHFQMIFDLIDTQQRSSVIMWIAEIAKRQPHLFTSEHIGSLIQEMFEGDDRYQSSFMMALEPLSRKIPDLLIPHMKSLMEGPLNIQYGAMYQVVQILKNLAVHSNDEKVAEVVMTYLEKQIKGPEDQSITATCLNEMRAIGGVYRPLLEKRKAAIAELRETSKVQTTKDQCTYILDILEGRSLKSLAEDIKEVKEDVEELDVRVTENELGLITVNQEVGQQKVELGKVKVDVGNQSKKIVELKKDVNDTKAKVEEIDGKTLSHAPFWARDVAKLMNPQDLLDWRLLSSRLGYTNDDIRNWSQMHDPCMAMLNEWYASRKTKEATFAVLTGLQEMDRMDAAVIVENAMKMSETVVEDEPFEYVEPPEVFISYQWGVQNEVKLLKQHLEMAGFTCWMDIGQMGGGDKLFEKIDQGARAAKVVISCVTEKYAKSPNCNREVNLSVSLGKPIIPLLMEKLSWPPPGSMGPIFSEYLFIRFFTRPGEDAGDSRYWSTAKFQELLMQLNYNNIKPNESKVDKVYRNWWSPMTEVIKIEKKSNKTQTAVSQQKQQEVESGTASPDVFISYQWGKQKQVQVLYKRLTELGFTVWMDIYQMGGGDSLYDKIDRGVRGSKIVLTCVTNKYSLSANCRREVSLADALKKPIVPLLLEKMTWPPSGPMSMVFTQLLYITFAKDESVQDRWDGDKFAELIAKLDEHVPDIVKLETDESKAQVQPAKPAEKKNPVIKEAATPPPEKPKPKPKPAPKQQVPPPPPRPKQQQPPPPKHQQQQPPPPKPQQQQPPPPKHQQQQSPPQQRQPPPPMRSPTPEPKKSKSCSLL